MILRKRHGTITMDKLSSLYNLVVNYFQEIRDVDGDGYYVISGLTCFIPEDRRLVEDFWKYIEHGLKETSRHEVFKATLTCISEFATTYREQISNKTDPVISYILDLYEVLLRLCRIMR